MGPSPAVAQVRSAVRDCLNDLRPGDLVLAACSGGADSLAAAAALAFAAPRLGLRAGGVTVDHGLQPGSAERAAGVAAVLADIGLDPAGCERVTVPGSGHGGPEAAARAARYRALEAAARRAGAVAVLLGHTLDDQAETVLLGLARGSGARSLAGMPAQRGLFRRPLLGVRRSVTRDACAALGLVPWDDPHNADARFSRARVRRHVLPVLESELGPGVAEALARTAALLRADADYLDVVAATETERAGGPSALLTEHLAGLPPAVRGRVLHAAAVAAGCPPGALAACHVQGLEALVSRWRGQRWIDLPGGIRAFRWEGQLRFNREVSRGHGRHGNRPEGSADHPGAVARAGG